jgi:hypothetical protein
MYPKKREEPRKKEDRRKKNTCLSFFFRQNKEQNRTNKDLMVFCCLVRENLFQICTFGVVLDRNFQHVASFLFCWHQKQPRKLATLEAIHKFLFRILNCDVSLFFFPFFISLFAVCSLSFRFLRLFGSALYNFWQLKSFHV